jgi:hypothetical protein
MNFDPLQELNILTVSALSEYDATNVGLGGNDGVGRWLSDGNVENYIFNWNNFKFDENRDNYQHDGNNYKTNSNYKFKEVKLFENYRINGKITKNHHKSSGNDETYGNLNHKLDGNLNQKFNNTTNYKFPGGDTCIGNNEFPTNNKSSDKNNSEYNIFFSKFASNTEFDLSQNRPTKPKSKSQSNIIPLKPSVTIASIDTFEMLRKSVEAHKSKRKSISEGQNSRTKIRSKFFMKKSKSTTAIPSDFLPMSTFFTQNKKKSTVTSPIVDENDICELFAFEHGEISKDHSVSPTTDPIDSLFAYSKNLDLSLDCRQNDDDDDLNDITRCNDDFIRTDFLGSFNFTSKTFNDFVFEEY